MNWWPFISRQHHEDVLKQLEARLADKDALLKEREAELAHLRPLFTLMPSSAFPKIPPAAVSDDFENPYDHLGNRKEGVPLPGEEQVELETVDGGGRRPRVIARRASRMMARDYAETARSSRLTEVFDTIEKEARQTVEAKMEQEQQEKAG